MYHRIMTQRRGIIGQRRSGQGEARQSLLGAPTCCPVGPCIENDKNDRRKGDVDTTGFWMAMTPLGWARA